MVNGNGGVKNRKIGRNSLEILYSVSVPPFYPIPLRATLLSADCTIRFIPDSNFNTEKHYYTGLPRPPSDVPYITILAWDVTVGLSGTYGVDTTYHNSSNTNEFSFFASTATVDVMSVNDPPLVQISQQGIAYSTVFREDGGAVPIVEPPQMFITDIDQDRLESVEVVLERVYDSGYENISLSLNAGVVVSGNYVYVNTSVNETERLVSVWERVTVSSNLFSLTPVHKREDLLLPTKL